LCRFFIERADFFDAVDPSLAHQVFNLIPHLSQSCNTLTLSLSLISFEPAKKSSKKVLSFGVFHSAASSRDLLDDHECFITALLGEISTRQLDSKESLSRGGTTKEALGPADQGKGPVDTKLEKLQRALAELVFYHKAIDLVSSPDKQVCHKQSNQCSCHNMSWIDSIFSFI
jgi:hypothetical protein